MARPPSITDLVSAEQRAEVLELLDRVTADLSLDELLPRIVDVAAELTGATYGVLAVLDDEGRMRDFHMHGLDDDEIARVGALPVGHGVLGDLLQSERPLLVDHLGSTPGDGTLPEGHPPIDRFLGVGIDRGERRIGVLYLGERRDGGPFTGHHALLLEWLADRASHVLALAESRRRADRRSEWLQVSARLAELLQPPLEKRRALTHVVELVSWLFHARAVALGRLVDDDLVLVAEDETDTSFGDFVRPEHIAPGTPVHAAVLTAVREHRPVLARLDTTVVVVVPVPLRLTERLVLGIVLRRGTPAPDQEELDLLASFTSQATSSIDRLDALAERAEMLVLADRERIARDLHDVVIQRLFATGLQLQGMRVRLPHEDQERLDVIVGDLDQTIRDIRTTIFELSQVRARSLRQEVGLLTSEYAELLGHAPTVGLHGPLDTTVSSTVADSLLATLREALSNVVKHARARAVEIELRVEAGVLTLLVGDDGVGFDGPLPESGLTNVRRRAQAFGGAVRVVSRAGVGTVLEWTVPLPD